MIGLVNYDDCAPVVFEKVYRFNRLGQQFFIRHVKSIIKKSNFSNPLCSF